MARLTFDNVKSSRRSHYLRTKKTNRGKVVKHELKVSLEACRWMRQVLPDVHFRTDTASGAFNSEYAKQEHMEQQSSDSEPDIAILAARKGYHGLVIELKADGVSLVMKRDGTKLRVFKNSKGKIIGYDTKIRKKGDWASLHIEKQAKCLESYNEQGYLGRFCVGLEQFKKLVCWYFDLEYIEPKDDPTLF